MYDRDVQAPRPARTMRTRAMRRRRGRRARQRRLSQVRHITRVLRGQSEGRRLLLVLVHGVLTSLCDRDVQLASGKGAHGPRRRARARRRRRPSRVSGTSCAGGLLQSILSFSLHFLNDALYCSDLSCTLALAKLLFCPARVPCTAPGVQQKGCSSGTHDGGRLGTRGT